jgi:AsmA protein
MKKILSTIAAVLIIVIITLFILVKIYVTPEKVRNFIIPQAETALNRKVTLDKINISIFKGIEISNLSIKEADGTTDFLTSKEFVLKYKFFPLLTKKLVINELRILSPTIRIVRDRDGKFNFETIGKKQTGMEKEEKKESEKAEKTEDLPVSLLVSKLIIDHAGFYFKDNKNDLPEVKGTLDINTSIKGAVDNGLLSEGRIDLKLDKIVLKDTPKPIENINVMLKYAVNLNLSSDRLILKKADLTLQDISTSITGDIKALRTSPQINLAVSLNKTETGAIIKLATLFADLKDISLSGEVSSETKITGRFDALHAEGHLNLTKINARYKDIPAAIDGDIKFKYSPDAVSVDTSNLIIQKMPVSIEGSIVDITDIPFLDISISVPDTNASTVQKLAGSFTDLKGISLSGKIGADINLKGRPDKIDTLKAKGSVRLLKMGVTYNKINALFDGDLKINEKTIDIDLNTSCGKNSMQIKGTVESYMKNQNIKLNIYSKKLYIDELLQSFHTTDNPPAETGRNTIQQTPAKTKEPGPVNLTLTAGGEIKIDSVVYQGLTIDNFYMTYRFKNNRLDLKGTGNAGKGDFELKTLIDLSKRGYSYTASGSVNSLYFEELVNTFQPKIKNSLFGILTTSFRLNGAGTLPHNLKKNLVANSNFNIKNGKISTVELTKKLSQLLNLRELETIEFTKAEGTFNIKNGTAVIDSIFQSDKLTMNPKGNIGLVDETLDLAFDLKLSPRLTKKTMGSSISQYIRDKDGWGTVPLVVTGTLSKPKYKVEVKKVGKKIIDTEINKLLEKLWGN